MLRRLLLLFILLLLAAGAAIFYSAAMPYAGFEGDVFVDIEPRTSTRQIAALLERKGVIRSQNSLLVARALRSSAVLQAGEYRFSHPASALEVLDRIVRGDVFYYELRIPEGSNMFDIAAAIEKLGTMKEAAFLKVAKSNELVKDIAPLAPSLEGYLFPSTYRITRHTTAQQIAREMVHQFRRVWTELGGPQEQVNRLVTLASLVEKETAVPEERPTVASVYLNRLNIGMKLDCDPTTIYAAILENRYRGTIYRSDLESTNPYNTYRNTGLPPGPISSPGVASLKAALHPAQTNYLYFVAKSGGVGAHTFSETLEQHNAAVRDYRNGQAR
jgi:UPF0755 protein